MGVYISKLLDNFREKEAEILKNVEFANRKNPGELVMSPVEDQLGVSPLFQRRLRPGNNCGGALLLPVVVRVGRKFKKPTKV